MTLRVPLACAVLLLCAACERVEDPPPVTPRTDAAVGGEAGAAPTPTPTASQPAAAPGRPRLAAAAIVLDQWQEAGNRARCAPLSFASAGGARGAPRPADFSGGWAVAFDLPNMRSAYGVAGPGLVPADEEGADAQRARLQRQWPYFRDLAQLPQPAFAGYGIEGAAAYPAANSNGLGENSLAYLRVGDQACTYNVWSRLGRAHLETLLDSLRVVPVD